MKGILNKVENVGFEFQQFHYRVKLCQRYCFNQ